MSTLSIGEVARRAGLRPSAIRYYESLGILPAPERVNGRRRYDPDVLYLLTAVGIAKQAGFTMAEIRQLLGGSEAPSAVWERFARRKLADVDDLIRRAERMRALLLEGMECDCLGLEECVVVGRRFDTAPEVTAGR